jgi:hypothetical protein
MPPITFSMEGVGRLAAVDLAKSDTAAREQTIRHDSHTLYALRASEQPMRTIDVPWQWVGGRP